MNSRELIIRTLEFDNPVRIPRHLWLLPWAKTHYPNELIKIQRDFPDDIVIADGFLKTPPKTIGDAYQIGKYVDEWGCEFESRQAGIIGEVKNPRVTDVSDISSVTPPIEALDVNTDGVNCFCRDTDKFVLAGCLARPFERLQFLRGTENLMMDLAANLPDLMKLLQKVHQFYIREIEVWCQTEVDGIWFMDDWGAQRALLISPQMWRKIFKPLYADYIRIIHDHGKKAFMHSDGCITDIIGDLVQLGLDALNSQIFCMDIESLGRQYKGKLAFWGEMDRQHLLPYGSEEDIVSAVMRTYGNLYHHGGIIAQLEFGPGAKPQNVYKTLETWDSIRPNG
jgi:uroporphyrinogen decarboxylase